MFSPKYETLTHRAGAKLPAVGGRDVRNVLSGVSSVRSKSFSGSQVPARSPKMQNPRAYLRPTLLLLLTAVLLSPCFSAASSGESLKTISASLLQLDTEALFSICHSISFLKEITRINCYYGVQRMYTCLFASVLQGERRGPSLFHALWCLQYFVFAFTNRFN